MSAPTFMRDDLPIQRPALGELVIGSPVVVSLPRQRARVRGEKVPAEVTAKARVWVTLTETATDRPRTWRMRLDSQDEGDQMYTQRNAWFRTPEQEIHEDALREARIYLNNQGIWLDTRSPWSSSAWNTLRLARMVWRADNDAD